MPKPTRWCACALLLLAGCGPSDEEVGRAVLLASPFFFLAGWAALRLLLILWRRLRQLHAHELPSAITGILLVLVMLALTIGVSGDSSETALFAIWIAGSSYLSLLLVTWRIWFHFRPSTAFTWAHVPVLVVMLAPAVPMALGLTRDAQFIFYYLWIFPGYLGVPATLILVGLIIEVFLHRRPAET